MATNRDDKTQQRSTELNFRADQGFFLAISVALSLLIVVGFGQLVLRGINNPIDFPLRVHVHAVFLIGWLSIFSYQNWLAYKGNMALHRTLGWATMLLVVAIVVANLHVTVMTIVDGRLGPQLSPGFFVSLGTVDTLTFSGLVAWAIIQRRNTQWHRRLMFGATLMLSAAGINRLLGSMFGPMTEAVSIACQLVFVAVLAWHDRRVLGRIHTATALLFLIVLLQRLSPAFLGEVPLIAEFAESFVG